MSFFFNDTATTEIYTLSLHDALPIFAMLNQETGLRGYLITREERFLQPYEAGVADLEDVDAQIASWTGVDAELAGRLAELTAAHQQWTEDWVRPMLAEQPAVGDAVALAELLRQDKALFDHYRAIEAQARDRKSTRLNSSHANISYAVFCLK